MSDDTKLTEDGLELQESVASKFDELLESAAAGATVSVTLGGVLGAAVFIAKFIALVTDDGSTNDALRQLQRQVNTLRQALQDLRGAIADFADAVAIEFNQQKLTDLESLAGDVHLVNLDMQQSGLDLNQTVSIANRAGITVDMFLHRDFQIWRWNDVVLNANGLPQIVSDRFKSLPTLPIYLSALLSWLAAREKVVRLGARRRLDDDTNRIRRHLNAVSVRPIFDKYAPPSSELDASTPRTITENIKWRIRANVVASNRHPRDRVCQYFFDLQDWMTGRRHRGGGFDVIMESDHVLCTIDPRSIGAPAMEIEAETREGVDDLLLLADVLDRVSRTRSLAQQVIGVFPTEISHPPAIFYVIETNGDLTWYSNLLAGQPGGSTRWQGPNRVGLGWTNPKIVFSGGGLAIYAVHTDGILEWFGHEGHNDGEASWRPQPLGVGSGWHAFERVFSGGEGVIYGVLPDGNLRWHRHDGALTGDSADWAEPAIVGTGWTGFHKVFSGGKGVIYTIDREGVLIRHVHTGYLTGAAEWELQRRIGTGFTAFPEVIAAANGVLYLFTRDGRVLRRRWNDAPGDEDGGFLEEAIEVRRGVQGFHSAFALMESAVPFIGPN